MKYILHVVPNSFYLCIYIYVVSDNTST